MPRPKSRIHPPLPSQNEIDDAQNEEREVVALSAYTIGQLLFLRVVFRTGHTSTIYMRPQGAD